MSKAEELKDMLKEYKEYLTEDMDRLRNLERKQVTIRTDDSTIHMSGSGNQVNIATGRTAATKTTKKAVHMTALSFGKSQNL